MSGSGTRLLGLDWGTTSLRVHRLAPGGVALETRQLPLGVAHIIRDRAGRADMVAGFEQAFEEACGEWVRAYPGVPVIACGMVGSAQGWREAPYVEVPASLDRLAPALIAIETASGATLHIVPGLVERGRLPNVMRGEETQIVGALEETSPSEVVPGALTVVGLPGTHSKWAQVRDGAIVHFDTFMTGEVYEALLTHTLLAHTLRRRAGWDLAAFDRGASVARSPEGRAGALATIFTTRALAVTGALAPEAQADYLSGLLIGHEVRGLEDLDRRALDSARIVLAGDDSLCRRYQRVLATFGHASAAIVPHTAERGLWLLAGKVGLVDAPSEERARTSLRPARAGLVEATPDSAAPVPLRPARAGLVEGPRGERARAPLRGALDRCGLVAILRGVEPGEASDVGGALYGAGFRALEVPLNSPDPLASIRVLRQALASDCAIGAGTVLSAAEVEAVRQAGGEFVVMPHSDAAVIRAARAAGLEVAPGVATITEAFAALAAGADVLKMFPADELGLATLAAWHADLPAGTAVVAVGGITPANLASFIAAGATALGLGSALYRRGLTATDVARRAATFVACWRAAIERPPAADR